MAKFPDLTGDGEVTQADILKGRGVYKKGGSVMKHDHGHKPMAKMSHGGHYCWGGKVMKKAKGGPTASEMVKYSKDKGREDTSWIEKDGKADPRDTADLHFKNFQDKIKEEFPKNYEDEPSVRTRAYSEKAKDFGKEGQVGMKRGGMAKGGNWIKSAIKKPGALKKSLGVPMDKPIPAKKLEKASKAPGKMGQRARLAMTLKGMK